VKQLTENKARAIKKVPGERKQRREGLFVPSREEKEPATSQ